jgi:apolipoprotein N-acyltransferase
MAIHTAGNPGVWQSRVAALSGWRRRAAAVGLGILAAGAMPPLYLVFLLVPAFVGLVWLVDASPSRRAAFGTGWWFGLGHFTAGLYWLAIAFSTRSAALAWLGPVGVLALAAVLAFFPAIATLIVGATRGPSSAFRRILVLGVAWTALEWVRSWIFTGFPWNLLGSVWTFSDAMIQMAAVTGVFGLSLVTVIAAAMPAVLTDSGAGERRKSAPVIFAFCVLAIAWGGGLIRLASAPHDMVPDVRLRLVQPNIPQHLKWKRELRQGHVIDQIRLSLKPAEPAPTHVIWGETMVPFPLANSPKALAAVSKAAPAGGLVIAGAPRTSKPGQKPFRVWNSLHAVKGDTTIAGTFDKFHLVPFGEYVPLRRFVGFGKLTEGFSDFTAGDGLRTIRLPGLPPVGPLICYEIIFPGQVVDGKERPDWLLNLTNDAWYGVSSGPYQHFATARMRAVEEGLPVVRVANTGISGVIDAHGRVHASLGLEHRGVLDSGLPIPLDGLTPFARFGNGIIGLGALLVLLAGFLPNRRL